MIFKMHPLTWTYLYALRAEEISAIGCCKITHDWSTWSSWKRDLRFLLLVNGRSPLIGSLNVYICRLASREIIPYLVSLNHVDLYTHMIDT